MSTCNRLDLQTLGSHPIMPKNLTDQWSRVAQYSLVTSPCTHANSSVCDKLTLPLRLAITKSFRAFRSCANCKSRRARENCRVHSQPQRWEFRNLNEVMEALVANRDFNVNCIYALHWRTPYNQNLYRWRCSEQGVNLWIVEYWVLDDSHQHTQTVTDHCWSGPHQQGGVSIIEESAEMTLLHPDKWSKFARQQDLVDLKSQFFISIEIEWSYNTLSTIHSRDRYLHIYCFWKPRTLVKDGREEMSFHQACTWGLEVITSALSVAFTNKFV